MKKLSLLLCPLLASTGSSFKDALWSQLQTEALPSFTEVLDAFDMLPTAEGFERALPHNREAPLMADMTCNQAIDQLYLDAYNFSFGSIFYLLLNGWYLGAWGDYGSCVADATYGQYVLVTINGDYDTSELALFTRGTIGKSKKFSTNVGLCMPQQCNETDMALMTPRFTRMAENANWTSVDVSYRFSSRDDQAIKQLPTPIGVSIISVCVLTLIALGIAGTVIELSHLGDIPNLDYKRLAPVAKFVSIKQYEPILMQRKRPWAQFALVFSALRNFMHLSRHPRAYQIAQNPALTVNPNTAPLTKYMTVFSGIMGFGLIMGIWCATYFFSWYGVYDNPQDLQEMRGEWAFTLVPAGFLLAPLMIYVMAFVNTFSLMHNKEKGDYVTIGESLWFILKKFLKLTPFNLVILWWAVRGQGGGVGPYWDLFPQAIKGCTNGNWVYNLVFLQNLLPSAYDEKCLPWTWFPAVYLQLCLTLPVFIMLYERLPKLAQLIGFTLLIGGITAGVFLWVYKSTTGIFLTFDEGVYFNYDFLNTMFMKPWFHLVAHLYGFISCQWFLSYVKDRSVNATDPDFATRMFTFVRNNGSLRYVLYLIGATMLTVIVFGIHGYIKDNSSWGRGLQAFYAAFAYPLYPFAASLFLLPALTGRAEFVRFFFGGEIWSMFRSISYGLSMFMPLYALNYFLSMSNSQHLDYQMMFYNFCGILIFSLIFTEFLFVFCDRPFHALMNLRHDLKMVSTQATINPETAFNIESYKVQKEGYKYIPPIGDSSQEKSTTMFDFSNSNNQSRPAKF